MSLIIRSALIAAIGGIMSACALAAGTPDQPLPASPRLDEWTVIGPGGGGAQYRPVVSPFAPSKVFVSCDMTGTYVTEDAGTSWRMLNLHGVTDFVVFDPVDKNVVYAKSIGLWRSADAGKTWALIYPSPDDVKGIICSGDHAEESLDTNGRPVADILALAVDPGDSNTLYAVFAGGAAQGASMKISTDSAKTWTDAGALPAPGRKIAVDPASPRGNRTVYVVADNSVSIRQNGEWKHQPAAEGVRRFSDAWIGFWADNGKPVIYAVASTTRQSGASAPGIRVSHDGGASWENRTAELMKHWPADASVPRLNAIAACATRPDVVYVSFRDPDSRDAAATSASRLIGVAKSEDGGKTWELAWKDTFTKAAANYEGVWIDERYAPTWGDAPFSLGVAPTNPDICYGTDYGRTVRTLDGGKTWKAISSRRVPGGAWTTTGLDVSCCYAVHFDPFDLKHCFISYTDIGLMVSNDGGRSWDSATRNGVPGKWNNATYWIEFDPEVKDLLWAAMSGVHDLPRAKMWRNGRRFEGGIAVSTDGGKNWHSSGDWNDNKSVITHMQLDPKSPAGKRTIYAAAFGRGVLKSEDNGQTWVERNLGITQQGPLAWRIWRGADDMLCVVIFRGRENGPIGTEFDGAVYRSSDGAAHWEPVALPSGVNGPTDVALDPKVKSRIVLSAWGRPEQMRDVGGGIYLSNDDGKTWSCVLDKDQHIHDLTFDPRNGVYYACGHEGSAWRSTDGGKMWTRIGGYNFKWGRKVVPDPNNPEFIYVTTFGGSVWYGPAAGDPDAVEDVTTKSLRHSAD